VAAVSGQVRGTVTLACTLNTGTLDLAEMLERVRDRHPGVIVKLRQSSSGSAGNLRSVRDGSVDIALCASGGNGHVSDLSRGVVLYDLWSEPMVLCAARTTRSPAGTGSPPPISGKR
jgi:Transcriptional regulator